MKQDIRPFPTRSSSPERSEFVVRNRGIDRTGRAQHATHFGISRPDLDISQTCLSFPCLLGLFAALDIFGLFSPGGHRERRLYDQEGKEEGSKRPANHCERYRFSIYAGVMRPTRTLSYSTIAPANLSPRTLYMTMSGPASLDHGTTQAILVHLIAAKPLGL